MSFAGVPRVTEHYKHITRFATHGMSFMLGIRNINMIKFLGFQRSAINHC